MSIEKPVDIKGTNEIYCSVIMIPVPDMRPNKNEPLAPVMVTLEYDNIWWNDDTGDRVKQQGLGRITRELTPELAVRRFNVIDPLTGETISTPADAVRQILAAWADEVWIDEQNRKAEQNEPGPTVEE